ncbi:MAG: phage tail length tape measure family protein, partial [Alphaproteobacteria bacterium]|nr:phage tail length tape measure family protein [Alphaproteobacteria bacterium]
MATDVTYGIRLKGDASGFVAESTRAAKSLDGVAAGIDKVKSATVDAAGAAAAMPPSFMKAALGAAEVASKAAENLNRSHVAGRIEQDRLVAGATVLAKSHLEAGRAAEISAGQMSMGRRIVSQNLINIGNVAVATKGDLVSMLSPLPDVVYGLKMMGVGFSGVAAAGAAAFAAVAAGVLVVGSHLATTAGRTRELTVAMKAMGNSGISGEQLRLASEGAAHFGPFGRTETFAAARGLASVRSLSGSMMKEVLGLAVNVSAAMGMELTKGTELLVQALDGGYAGIKQLDDQFGFLTATELEQVRAMSEHGRVADALKMTVDALNRRFKGLAEEGMSAGTRAFHDLGQAWNRLLDDIAGSDIAQTMARGMSNVLGTLASSPDPGRQWEEKRKELADAEARVTELQSGRGGWSPVYGTSHNQELRAVRETVARLRDELNRLTEQALTVAENAAADGLRRSAETSRAVLEQSGKTLDALARDLDRERVILMAPAPSRELVRAKQTAEDFVRDKKVGGINPKTGQPFADEITGRMTGAASAKMAASARDETAGARLQAEAQARLAKAAGVSSEAQRQAAVANKIAEFSYRHLGIGVKEYASEVLRAYEAEKAQRRAEWTRDIDRQTAANDNLIQATRNGSTAALDAAEREN